MFHTCPFCNAAFEVTQDDLVFLEKVSPVFNGKKELIPPPTLCPDCRSQRRMSWRNERTLYKSTCGLCGQGMFSLFPGDSPFPVYCPDCWWSDRWDPAAYGREFDFSRSFFEQFQELMHAVPKAAVLQLNNENCAYNSLLAFSRNAYMCPGSFCVEDCYYVRKSQYSRDCADSNVLNRCELVADSMNCDSCFASHHLINCRNCSSSRYLADCTRLKDCFMCSGLSDKQYCVKNVPLTRQAYEEALLRYATKRPEDLLNEFLEFNRTVPKRAQIQLNCDGSTGDYLANCHNAFHCSDCINIEDSKYLVECEGVKDSMDLSMHDKEVALSYELCSGGEKSYLTRFGFCPVASPNTLYTYSCFFLEDSFGCDGLHARRRNCILNKQYTKEEYEALVPKIIAHMRKDGGALNRSGTPNVAAGSPATPYQSPPGSGAGHAGSWGEFFPVAMSPYAYNESTASEYFPIPKEEVLRRGWRWRDQTDEIPKVERIIPAAQLPDSINDVSDDILHWAIECEVTKRPFKIIKQELEFYRNMKLPIPRFHPDERHRRRMALRNPRKLWNRDCANCHKPIATSYSPERLEVVNCEECYLRKMY